MRQSGRVLIIGGGIAGLSAGTYLRMNGYDTCIFEMHSIPGGLCTAWKQDGYTFDACIHWLVGSGPWSRLHRAWDELGALEGRTFIEHDEYVTVDLDGGDKLVWYTDIDRLERELLRLGPEDADQVRRLGRDLRAAAAAEIPIGPGLYDWTDWLRLVPAVPGIARVLLERRGQTMAQFAAQLRSPKLRQAFSLLYPERYAREFPVLVLLMMTTWMHRRTAGYPIGGSLPFALAIEHRYKALGGEIHYDRRVRRILVENGAACGVELEDGTVHRGDDVVSAADGHATLFDMLGGKYLTPRLREAYGAWPRFPSLLYVSLGIGRELKHLPHMLNFAPPAPIVCEDGANRIDRLAVRIFNFDPTMAPPGKTAVTFMIDSTGFEWWSNLRAKDPERYAKEKKALADAIIDAFDRRAGGIRDAVEAVDVATPATWHRYTGNWQGSYEGWMPTAHTMMSRPERTLPGLARFHMVGQWVNPGGGLPPAAMDGRALAREFCKRDGKTFVVRRPPQGPAGVPRVAA